MQVLHLAIQTSQAILIQLPFRARLMPVHSPLKARPPRTNSSSGGINTPTLTAHLYFAINMGHLDPVLKPDAKAQAIFSAQSAQTILSTPPKFTFCSP